MRRGIGGVIEGRTGQTAMSGPLDELTNLTEAQLAVDPRIALLRMTFEFLVQQQYFGAAATMVAEYIDAIRRLEVAESSGNLSVPSVKAAAILWRREVKGFKHWYGADDDETIARMMQNLTDNGVQNFVYELAVELQVNRPGESG